MKLLEVKNVEISYGPVNVVKGISFDIPEKAIVTILGANGAGKTTIMRAISGLIEPDKGKIIYNGEEIQGRTPEEIVGMGISHVPEGREVFPALTVRKNLLMGAYIRKDKSGIKEDMQMVYNYFPILRERRDQLAYTLSGGEQQMLVIGRALMSHPRILLLDEPSLGLSPFLVKNIFSIIKRINREENAAVLLVEQNARMALRAADHGYILEMGRIVMDDSTERLENNDDVKEFYLGIKEGSIRGTRRWKKKKQWR